jgi:hypothetical protein
MSIFKKRGSAGSNFIPQALKRLKSKIYPRHIYNLAICAVFRDEAKILPEWLAYHRVVGVDHFFLYNHESCDNFQRVLDPYIQQKIVTLNHIPHKGWIHREQWQRESYNHFLKSYGSLCKWCGYFDLDEFIVPVKQNSLPELLADYDLLRVGSIEIKWQCFGTSFVPTICDGQLYTETLTLKAKPEHRLNAWGKVIARPRRQSPWPAQFSKKRKLSVHHAVLKKGYKEISISLEDAQLNHYLTRDQYFFHHVRAKIRRNTELFVTLDVSLEEIEKEFNQNEDTKIQKFLPWVRKQGESVAFAPEQCHQGKTLHQYDLAIAAIFQNEAPYMKEWIEFHKLVGVQHFYLLNNLSNDHYAHVLKPYIEKGEVELIEWPYDFSQLLQWRKIQPGAYDHALDVARGKVKWLAIIDLDEFLFPVHEDNLASYLDANYSQFGGVVINWQMYGTSHVPSISRHKLMIETLLLKTPVEFVINGNYKSIIQLDRAISCRDPHAFLYKEGYYHVDTNKKEFMGKQYNPWDIEKAKCPAESKLELPMIHIDKIRINHYWSRDESYFHNVKIPRQLRRSDPLEYWLKYEAQLNQVLDTTILRFAPRLRKAMKLDLNPLKQGLHLFTTLLSNVKDKFINPFKGEDG